MIRVHDLSLRRGTFSLRDIAFEVRRGSYAVLMGASGSGKTSIVESICGLQALRSGVVLLNGRDVTHADPSQRNVGYVPQDAVLFPTMKVRRQIELPLRLRRWPRRKIRARIEALAELLGVESLLHRKVGALSGGERQRVAIARAVAAKPPVVLLDEPLSALDEDTRASLAATLGHLRTASDATFLHVTHSTREAARLGEVLLRLEHGMVCPVASPHERVRVPIQEKPPVRRL